MTTLPAIEDFDEPEVTAVIMEVRRSFPFLIKFIESEDSRVGLARLTIRADPREKFITTQVIPCGQRLRLKSKTTIAMPSQHIDFDDNYLPSEFLEDLVITERESGNPNFRDTVYFQSLWLRDENTSSIAVFETRKAVVSSQRDRLAQEGKFRLSLTLEGIYRARLSKRGKLKLEELLLRVPRSQPEFIGYKQSIRSGEGSYSELTVAAYDTYIPNISALTDLKDTPIAYRDCTYGLPDKLYKIPKHCNYYTRKQLMKQIKEEEDQ